VLRIEVSEEGQEVLPAIDVDDTLVVIGSTVDAHVRLPADGVERRHVVIERGRWRASAAVDVESGSRDAAARTQVGSASRKRGDDASQDRERDAGAAPNNEDGEGRVREGEIGGGVVLAIGRYRVRIAPAPAGSKATPPQRTESLARELMRSLLGASAAPSFEVERGPTIGEKRVLAAPESTLVIGRGDEAGWILLDEDLSRTHAEVRRGWDGTRIADLGSKNGTKLDGIAVGREGAALPDGALVELGKVTLRFRDPADARLRATPGTAVAIPTTKRPVEPVSRPAPVAAPTRTAVPLSRGPFYLAIFILVTALTGLVWILALA
jgi:hypothetical protein